MSGDQINPVWLTFTAIPFALEMLEASQEGDNRNVDMLVGDIYGTDYSKIGLKSTTIASSMGKVFKKNVDKRSFKPEDISRSLLYMVR